MVSDLTTFAYKGCKLLQQKNFLLQIFLYLFTSIKRFLAPTSKRPISNLFYIFEILEKKKLKNCCEKKGSFSPNFALLLRVFGICASIGIGWEILCLQYAGLVKRFFVSNMLDFFLFKIGSPSSYYPHISKGLVVSWMKDFSVHTMHMKIFYCKIIGKKWNGKKKKRNAMHVNIFY